MKSEKEIRDKIEGLRWQLKMATTPEYMGICEYINALLWVLDEESGKVYLTILS